MDSNEALAPDRCCAEPFQSEAEHRCLISESRGSRVIFSHRCSNEASTESTLVLWGGGLLEIGNDAAAKLPLHPPHEVFFFYISMITPNAEPFFFVFGCTSQAPDFWRCILKRRSALLAWNNGDLVASGKTMNIYSSSKQLWDGRSDWCQEKLSCLRHLIPN